MAAPQGSHHFFGCFRHEKISLHQVPQPIVLKIRQLVACVLVGSTLSSCATILGGPITEYQRTKPLPGQPQREVRVGALIADLLLVGLLGAGIDFATGAIYRPQPTLQGGSVPMPPPPAR